ncbi:hypothetical protein LAZ67_9003322 [Cordylochernes scorpioides]|uniref:Reverse transcriptase domain-containing protein n=1 Tax=Cordylochernes scorpioides TaxID=51811 RepID=A0ABY6KX62_9ARAC|nr:hypothetical protein LAZ67_9003322 [Cordylochernes scorpioides]
MAQIQPPETFDFSTPNEWPKWRKRFERYLVVSGMKKKEEADKIDLFMYLIGDRADDIFRTFKFEKEEEATRIDSVLKAFDSHFCVRKNIIYERAKFNSRIQEDREPVDEFITSLYKLADSCEFEGLHEQLIRDRIVVGVRDKALSERMQLDSELTLEKAVKMVRQQEAVRQQQVDLQRPSTSQKVNQVKFNSKKQSPKQQQQPSRKKEKSAKIRSRCPKCGGFTHREGQACRAEGQKCNLCSKTGHFANCCPDKQAKTAEVKAVSELDEEIGFLLEVSAVEDSSNLDNDEDECRRRWTAEIQVNGKKVKFKLDSQADVTCVPLCLFKKIMGQQRLVESDINLRAAELSELQTVGMFISTLRNGNYEIKEKIYVIRRLSEPLLSRRACELLNLARRIEVVATRINPIKDFPEVFEGLGQIGNPYEIKLKPGAKPYAVHTPRRVPIPLMEKLKTRLEELEKAGIIAQVNVATEWCAPTVIAGKPNGDIRLCVDLSRLNEHVQREVHPMPVVEHMLGQLGEARFFSKLDANSGFHQIPLSPDCQHLTTFITPFGRYKYCRMPFGISLAPEYFQRVMSIILQGMDGVMCYLDDILIFASDSKTHDRILRLVLRKLKEAKVTLNKAKCVFGVPRINFLGHILDEDGIRPDPAKIEAVARMPAPTDVHGVRRFLGMVNHLGRFVENLSEIVAPLNQLLVKGQDFVWDCSQERAFRKLKELLTTQPILAAYDVRKPTMVSSDASSYGLGAVLKQEGLQEDSARRAEEVLKSRAQKAEESSESYIQEILSLCHQVNPRMEEAASLRTLTLCLDQLLNRESEEAITYDGDEPAAHFFSQLESQPNFHNLEPARQARKALSSLRGEPRKIAQDLALLNKTYEEVKESLCAVYPRRPSFTLQEFYELKCTSMAEIETYYKNKVRIGLAINLPKSAIVQALSNGVSRNYGNLLKMAQPSGPEEWLCLAQQLTYEGDNTSTKAAQQRSPRQSRAPSTTVDKTPPYPCRYCGGQHWHAQCQQRGPYQRTFRTFTPAVHSVEKPKDRLGLQVSTRPQQRRAREKPSNANFGSRTTPKLNEPTCILNQHTPKEEDSSPADTINKLYKLDTLIRLSGDKKEEDSSPADTINKLYKLYTLIRLSGDKKEEDSSPADTINKLYKLDTLIRLSGDKKEEDSSPADTINKLHKLYTLIRLSGDKKEEDSSPADTINKLYKLYTLIRLSGDKKEEDSSPADTINKLYKLYTLIRLSGDKKEEDSSPADTINKLYKLDTLIRLSGDKKEEDSSPADTINKLYKLYTLIRLSGDKKEEDSSPADTINKLYKLDTLIRLSGDKKEEDSSPADTINKLYKLDTLI